MASASRLMDEYRSAMSKVKGSNNNDEEFDVLYPTGFVLLDYLNGTTVHVRSDKINMDYKSIGLVDGSSNLFIGRSNCGKSTLMFQIIGNIARMFPTADIHIDDIESSLPMTRKEFLLGLTKEELKERVQFRNTGITTENVYQNIRTLHDIKINNRSDYEYDTGLYDTYGNRIFKLVPSIYAIDSFAMLMPNDIMDNEELDGGMGATKVAKMNTQLVKKIVQLLKEANIIMLSINHINDDPSTGFLPKPAQIIGLKQGERLPGGKANLYIGNNMFRVDSKGQLKETEGFGIPGSIVEIELIKSRTNVTRRKIQLIFNMQTGGFDNELSMLHAIKQAGNLSGAGARLYFASNPDIKFSMKNFKEELHTNPELQLIFARECRKVLDPMLADTQNQVREDNVFDLNAMINSVEMSIA